MAMYSGQHAYRIWYLMSIVALLSGYGIARTEVIGSDDALSMGGYQSKKLLFVDQQSVPQEREEFVRQLRFLRKNQRPLYEKYLEVIGANGILDGIEQTWPKCHSQAHDLGKVIFARVHDIGTSLRICNDRCHSGCMHGVLMEAFASTLHPGEHADLAVRTCTDLQGELQDICRSAVQNNMYNMQKDLSLYMAK